MEAVRSGVGADVELVLGSNTDEHRFFLVPPGLIDQLDDSFVNAALQIYGGHPEHLREAYDERYSTAGELFAAAASDYFFRLPDIQLAEARLRAKTWMYEFAWRSPLYAGQLGACHYLEVPFVFDTLDAPSAALVAGPGAATGARRRDAPALARRSPPPATRAGLATRPSGARS